MTERIVAPRLADIIEAIERIRHVLDGVTLEAFEQNWEKRWLVERGIEIISEASRARTYARKRAAMPSLQGRAEKAATGPGGVAATASRERSTRGETARSTLIRLALFPASLI